MKERMVQEINKIKQMDPDKRLDYFKTYYLKATIAIVCGLILLTWLIKDTCFKDEPVCMGCAYGVELSDAQKEALTAGYLDYYGYNKDKCTAVLSTDNIFEDTSQKMDAYSHEMALYAQIAAGEIYYLILDKNNLDNMNDGGIYAELEEVLSNDEIKQIGDAIVKLPDFESEEEKATAIDLRKLGFLDENQEGFLVFTIARNDEQFPSRFVNYIEAIVK